MKMTGQTIRIPIPAIFSFAECRHFLDRGYDDCIYTIEEHRVIKPLRTGGQDLLFAVWDEAEALQVEILSGNSSREVRDRVASYVATWFDLTRDLRPFYRQLERYSQLAFMPKQYHGLRLMGIPDLFEALCWCVIGQQINLTFAYRLKRRLVETYGTFIMYDSKRHHFFPEAETLATLKVNDLKKLQFSRQKAGYIIGIAREFTDGTLSKQQLEELPERKQILKRLLKIRGVGPWTANYVLMKSLQRPDCITFGDTGLQSAVSSLLNLDRKPTRQEVESFFEPFAGWESYLNIYLWRTLS